MTAIQALLYSLPVLLLTALAYFGLRLRARTSSLRRRAAIEHVIATFSTRFINSRRREIAAHIEHALAELAACVGADRAYFVVAGKPLQIYRWSRAGLEFPPGWPEQALPLALRLDQNGAGAIQVHAPGRRPHRNLDAAAGIILRRAGVHEWLCIPSRGGRCMSGLLGFDAMRTAHMTDTAQFGLLRMAFDAIANAIDREFLDRERERLAASLQQASRMETIGALASGIAHNFNNIIGAILGYAETAQAHVNPESRPGGNLTEIRRAGERARDVVNQILTFGRRRDAHRSRICLKSLVAETKSLLDASLPPDIGLRVRETAQQTLVAGDPAQLQQVILNLCTNAAQAMDGTGLIEIGIEAREIKHALQLDHGELVPGGYAVISVTDPGRGMERGILEQIFEPFFTTRADGNGLGLAMVLEIVLEHGGAVQAQSAPGAGARFDVWLPCAPLDPPFQSQEALGRVGRGGGQTVLLLEADRVRLLRHEEILAALGYEPVGFANPAAAAAACLAAPTRFDAALLCCHLHESRTAIEHAAALRSNAPRLPIILAAVTARELGAPALAEAGVAAIVRYPLLSGELASALARCMSGPDSAQPRLGDAA